MITGLKGLAADGHEINCRTCQSGKTCNVANAHGYWVGACVRYTPEKPMTNADKIRQMTDEELAELLEGEYGNMLPNTALSWLKQEVEGDG